MAAPINVVPGERLGPATSVDYKADVGTYVRDNDVYTSLAGYLVKTPMEDGEISYKVTTSSCSNVVPTIRSIVTARVTNVNPRFCKCNIINIEGTDLADSFRGVIRKEDVRATEKDRVEMYKCFRPGDIILARVISLGDTQSYILSTAENPLGVVVAKSEAGASLVPISWCQMQCPKSLSKEYRKVAQAKQQYLVTS